MKKSVLSFFVFASLSLPLGAQTVLTLDSCRALALRNNKQIGVAKLKQDVATNTRKAMRTKYLPKVDAVGGYQLLSSEVSLLNDDQKNTLNNLGTKLFGNVAGEIPETLTGMVQQGLITPQQAQAFGQLASKYATPLIQGLNAAGSEVRQAFRTNNRNMMGASVMVRQPVYMGGAIKAANRMADISEELAAHTIEQTVENTLYAIDQTYWLVVQLRQKNKLAQNYLELVRKLDSDVQKMIREGVATRADGLKVSVKVNEAEMKMTQAEDGLALSKMLLCQTCGLPIGTDIELADENSPAVAEAYISPKADVNTAWENRTELKLLDNVVSLSEQSTRLVKAAYLPQVALTGGYTVTNPNVYNGYENKFGGTWSIGVLLRVPVWNWQEGTYKVRAAKAATTMAQMEKEEARELVELQVNQNQFKVREANKKYEMASKNVEKAEENLRSANLGFSEGVITATDVMAAQTAWLDAQTQKIDAGIDLRLTDIGLKKAMGVLR